MRFLLDTCAALYLWAGDGRLSAAAAEIIDDRANDLVFHQVSYLEITLKHSLGKLRLADPPSVLVPKALRAYGIDYAPLANEDIKGLEDLPWHHRDPFDRLLVAHARRHGLVFLTPDKAVRAYGVPVLW